MCDGNPIIEGTRTRVIDIAVEYEIFGHSPDEIIRSHPHVSLYQIHDALSYYYENRDDMDQKIRQDREFIRRLKLKYPSKKDCARAGLSFVTEFTGQVPCRALLSLPRLSSGLPQHLPFRFVRGDHSGICSLKQAPYLETCQYLLKPNPL